MWYEDEFLNNPYLSATLYLGDGTSTAKKSSAATSNSKNSDSSKLKKLASGWVDGNDTSFTIRHSWGDASNPLTRISDTLASVLNGGVSLMNAGAQFINDKDNIIGKGVNFIKERLPDNVRNEVNEIQRALSTQTAFVGSNSFRKQYSGTETGISDLEFTTVFINSDYSNPVDPSSGEFGELVTSLLPKDCKLVALKLLAKMSAPNGYKLADNPTGPIPGSYTLAIKGTNGATITGSSELKGGLGSEGIHGGFAKTNSSDPPNINCQMKLIPNLLVDNATISRSNSLVATKDGLRPSYYIVKISFTYGAIFTNDAFKSVL